MIMAKFIFVCDYVKIWLLYVIMQKLIVVCDHEKSPTEQQFILCAYIYLVTKKCHHNPDHRQFNYKVNEVTLLPGYLITG